MSDWEHCDDCGQEYQDVYRVDDDLWARLHERAPGGLLCPSCLVRRAARRWDSFPSDEDVEAAALTLHFADEGAMPARYYRELAREMLLAVKAREDGDSS